MRLGRRGQPRHKMSTRSPYKEPTARAEYVSSTTLGGISRACIPTLVVRPASNPTSATETNLENVMGAHTWLASHIKRFRPKTLHQSQHPVLLRLAAVMLVTMVCRGDVQQRHKSQANLCRAVRQQARVEMTLVIALVQVASITEIMPPLRSLKLSWLELPAQKSLRRTASTLVIGYRLVASRTQLLASAPSC